MACQGWFWRWWAGWTRCQHHSQLPHGRNTACTAEDLYPRSIDLQMHDTPCQQRTEHAVSIIQFSHNRNTVGMAVDLHSKGANLWMQPICYKKKKPPENPVTDKETGDTILHCFPEDPAFGQITSNIVDTLLLLLSWIYVCHRTYFGSVIINTRYISNIIISIYIPLRL